MQQTTGVALTATHFTHTDRRALSQAWYSALHLAGRAPRARPAAPARTISPAAIVPRTSRGTASESPQRAAMRDAARFAARRAPRTTALPSEHNAADAERRTQKAILARGIERGPARHAQPCFAASFALRAADGRVHLIVRTDAVRTRVVAVCAAPLRERVERALARARLALAGGGVRAEAA